MKSSLCLPALLFAFPPQATPENLLVPATWFQEITATDGSTQHSVVFTTVPGVEYTFFHSHDLVEWTEIGKTYGLGHEFAAAMFETAPAPPPPDPENPPATPPAFTHASVSIQPSSGAAGGTVVSWASLDHGNAVSTLILGNMAAAWQTVPLFAAAHGNHHFFIIHTSGDAAPPVENPQLDDMDAAMIADLEAGWVDINTAIATATETARNTPPPPPTTDDARGFWRIKADWSLDSDNDGSPDHLEFAMAAQAPAADGLAHNAFNADTNNDGIPDGEQLDSDGDGIPDAQDIAPNDGGVAYTIVPLPRYAMFTFADTPDGSFAINDRGTVLFPGKVWKAGEFQNLLIDQRQIPGYTHPTHAVPDIRARAINDNDQIIGSGSRFVAVEELGGDPWYFDAIFHWSSPQAVPIFVALPDGGVTTYAELRDGRHVRHLDNEGNFFSPAFIWDEALAGAGPPGEDAGWKKWTLPAGAAPLVAAPAAEFTKGTAPGGIVWSSEYDDPYGFWLESRITTPSDEEIPTYDPLNVLAQGGNGNLVATSSFANASTVIRMNGKWRVSPLVANALDIAADGTAIGKRLASEPIAPSILLNGKWTSLERAVPGIPERWKTSPAMSLSDTSPGGWILAHDRPGDPVTPDDISAALLPMRLKGQFTNSSQIFMDKAVGVDDFSIGSSDPDLHPENTTPVADRIWIMAPLGGPAKTVVLDAPLHATAGLKISSAPGITFSGEQEKLLTARGQSFSVLAGTGVSTGEEHLANLWINDGTYDTPSVSNPIGFKVMKHRTVNVTVYKIADVLTGTEGGIINADLVPSEIQLENHLNDIYGPQVNVTFDVVIKPVQVETPVDHDPNGKFDYGVDDHSHDQSSIILDAINQAGAASANTSIRLFLLGTHKQIANPNAVGAANILNRTCWVKAKVKNSARIDEEMDELLTTIAHEFGHIMIGEGHPSELPGSIKGPAPLPGTRHVERLMWAHANKPLGTPNILVKAEWDEIDSWLVSEKNVGRITD